MLLRSECWSWVSSGSMVSDYGLDDRAIGVRSPAGAKEFSSSLCVQTGSGAHPASCRMGTGSPFPGGKSAAAAWRWPLNPIWCRGREWVRAIPHLPPSASMACSGTALPFFYLFRSECCMEEFCFRIIAIEAVANIVGFSNYALCLSFNYVL
jgi:hypothetical protein